MLQQNSYKYCPHCCRTHYVQLEHDDKSNINTCHGCLRTWRSGHGNATLEYRLDIENKYIAAYTLLDRHNANDYVRSSKPHIAAFLRGLDYVYDNQKGKWCNCRTGLVHPQESVVPNDKAN